MIRGMPGDVFDPRFRAIYLNDHLAGATAMVELVRRAARGAKSQDERRFLERLSREIEDDRRTLLGVMREAGVKPSRVKQRLATLVEKAGRLKLNGTMLRRSPLSTLVELEAIEVGVGGKKLLWLALRDGATSPDTRTRFDELIARADEQLAELETYRLLAAKAVGSIWPPAPA
jgi:hypothetical protein